MYHRNKFTLFSVSLFLGFMISFSAAGDDLEIYLGSDTVEVTYKPNVLFIMDTSGSMASRDGTDTTRMQKVQDALRNALGNATNINAGLMRFSDYGGPILFPVRDIDSSVSPELVVPVTGNNDDAHEINNSVITNNYSLVLSQGTETVHTGLRFQNINIPRGAVITSAVLRFTSDGFDNSLATMTIRGESTGNANEFSTTNNDISNRATTSNQVIWDQDNAFPFWSEIIASPDLTPVIQEIVNRSDWCGGNNLAIVIETNSLDSNSARSVLSHDYGSGQAPQLVVTFDESSATGCVGSELTYQVRNQADNAEERSNGHQNTASELTFRDRDNSYIGLRFQNLAITQGATIKNAYLEFTSYNNYNNSGASMLIRGVNQDNPSNFRRWTRYLLRDKPKTSASVAWSSIPNWYRNGLYRSPPITNIVQEIVNRGGWDIGNNMMIVLSDFTNAKRGGYTYSGKPSGAAKLIIEFEGNATPETSSTVRQHLISKVDELTTNGMTPIVDTLYEATLYYGAMNMDYGRKRGESHVSSSVRRATRVSHRSSYLGADPVRPYGCTDDNLSSWNCRDEYIPLGAKYISPIQDLQCQTNNHIVLLSDGQANNNHSVSKIQSLLGKSCSGGGGEKCGVDLVKNIADAGDSVIDARITTHTIGFSANEFANNFLNQLALQSGGGFYKATDSEQLLEVFETILRQVKDVNTTFVSPGVAVNQLNRLSHRDELYFALFKPAEGTLWPGNLKKYKIKGNQVLDKNGLPAVDSGTGFFAENSHSYWSTLADGNDVRQGGAASKLNLNRDIYFFENQPGTIMSSSNVLHETNTNISTFDVATNVLPEPELMREQVLKWARGVDVLDDDGDGSTNDIREAMGDPIHSQPVIVNYAENDSAIYVATNHGFLHSFDAEDGSENFAIIPKELLGNLYEFYRDGSTFNHVYGLDGDIVARYIDNKIYLYIGMRRGGNNYYVFDVTSKTNPKLVFSVDGGTGNFANMGQTWSRPIITKMNIGGTVKNVMIVGGGYDELQDEKEFRSEDLIGNSVYIIDAENGNLLWSAGKENANLNLPEMKYSIPGRVSAVDRNNDGLVDHLYVADMGGQLFRFDVYNGESVSNIIKGGLLATFSGDTPETNRRFYYGADVSEILLGDEQYYAVAIGSGFRAGPLNTVIQDEFYMIKDKGVFQFDEYGRFKLPAIPYTQTDLYDATDHLLTSGDDVQRELEMNKFADKEGWMIRLVSGGEKVLASPLILDYKVFFTTYLPATASDSLCAPPSGNSRAYLVNILNGNAISDLNQNGENEASDRYAQLSQTGIAPDTKILIENIVKPVVCLGAECVAASIQYDDDGNEIACGTDFECLAQNLYGRFDRVQQDIWKTEIEKP